MLPLLLLLLLLLPPPPGRTTCPHTISKRKRSHTMGYVPWCQLRTVSGVQLHMDAGEGVVHCVLLHGHLGTAHGPYTAADVGQKQPSAPAQNGGGGGRRRGSGERAHVCHQLDVGAPNTARWAGARERGQRLAETRKQRHARRQSSPWTTAQLHGSLHGTPRAPGERFRWVGGWVGGWGSRKSGAPASGTTGRAPSLPTEAPSARQPTQPATPPHCSAVCKRRGSVLRKAEGERRVCGPPATAERLAGYRAPHLPVQRARAQAPEHTPCAW